MGKYLLNHLVGESIPYRESAAVNGQLCSCGMSLVGPKRFHGERSAEHREIRYLREELKSLTRRAERHKPMRQIRTSQTGTSLSRAPVGDESEPDHRLRGEDFSETSICMRASAIPSQSVSNIARSSLRLEMLLRSVHFTPQAFQHDTDLVFG